MNGTYEYIAPGSCNAELVHNVQTSPLFKGGQVWNLYCDLVEVRFVENATVTKVITNPTLRVSVVSKYNKPVSLVELFNDGVKINIDIIKPIRCKIDIPINLSFLFNEVERGIFLICDLKTKKGTHLFFRNKTDFDKSITYFSVLADPQGFITYISNIHIASEDKRLVVMNKENEAIEEKSSVLDTLEDPYENLDKLIGLNAVKRDVKNLTNLVRVQEIRKKAGQKTVPVSLHLVFTGNPGTGKTTIARILGAIYRDMGILSKGQLIEVDRAGLVAGYVGQTAIKTQEKINEAKGGILFIDEAYTLAKEGNDFGQEAIDTILKAMEDMRNDFIVIVAGYPDLMQRFINSNPGLKSRFNKYFVFEDYSAEELYQIFCGLCREYGYRICEAADAIIRECINVLVSQKDVNFANAREIRNMFEKIITNQANRIAENGVFDNEKINVIMPEDIHG